MLDAVSQEALDDTDGVPLVELTETEKLPAEDDTVFEVGEIVRLCEVWVTVMESDMELMETVTIPVRVLPVELACQDTLMLLPDLEADSHDALVDTLQLVLLAATATLVLPDDGPAL